jgi:hypothetical protein
LALWALWTQRLHRSTEEFWFLTPREIEACIQAFLDSEKSHNVRAGTIAASIYNVQRSKSTDPSLTWEDFFGEPKPLAPQTADMIGASFDMYTALIQARKGS